MKNFNHKHVHESKNSTNFLKTTLIAELSKPEYRRRVNASNETKRLRKLSDQERRDIGCEKFVIFNTGDISVPKFYRQLAQTVSAVALDSVFMVNRKRQQTGSIRFEIWTTPETSTSMKRLIQSGKAVNFKSVLGANARPKAPNSIRWKIDFWRQWRDRPIRRQTVTPISAKSRECNIATLNINGLRSKIEDVSIMLDKEEIAICAIQETLIEEDRYPIWPSEYSVNESPRSKGFRGHCLLIRKDLTANSIKTGNKGILHSKVYKIPGTVQPTHVLAVYAPSGSTHRVKRRKLLEELRQMVWEITLKEPESAVIIMGDFNAQVDEIRKTFLSNGGMEIFETRGRPETRWPSNKSPSAIDHIMVNANAKSRFRAPRVLRDYAMSDHRPLKAAIRAKPTQVEIKATSEKLDLRLLYGHGREIVNHPAWKYLVDVDIMQKDDLDHLAEDFSDALTSMSKALGIRKAPTRNITRFPRKLQELLRKKNEAGRELVEDRKVQGNEDQTLRQKFNKASKTFKGFLKSWREKRARKELNETCAELRSGEQAGIWRRVRKLTGLGHSTSTLQPVKNKAQKLCTSDEDIIEAVKEHYEGLANDVPGNSQNEEHWRSTPTGQERKDPLEGINDPITWRDVLVAIRHMKTGTAEGPCEIHVNVLKEVLTEECRLQVEIDLERAQEGSTYVNAPEGTRFALPESELPEEPLTLMGKVLYQLLTAIWRLEQTPSKWDEVHIANLFKFGNPEDLKNYRGISLMSVGLKIIMTIMNGRISQALEGRKDFCVWQAGFRKGEEAIGQYIALAETIRRRQVEGKETMGIFIDFVKAFDKMEHEAMYRVLDDMGIRGKSLNIIKWYYRNTKMKVKVGGKVSDVFGMARGTRQGCPISPLLFIIFVNSLFNECPAAGVQAGSNSCLVKGLQFADDALVLSEPQVERLRELSTQISAWAKKWGMEISFIKSGCILWSEDEEKVNEFKKIFLPCGEGVIPPIEESYKYLGILTTSEAGAINGDERTHSKRMAKKAEETLHLLRPILTNQRIPPVLKIELVKSLISSRLRFGGEWTGFKAENAKEPQKVLNKALKLLMRNSYKSNVQDMTVLHYELGVLQIETDCGKQRARLVAKLENRRIRSTLGVLDRSSFKNRKKTWLSTSRTWLAKIQPTVSKWDRQEPPFRQWIGLGNSWEMDNRRNDYKDKQLEEFRDKENELAQDPTSLARILSSQPNPYPTTNRQEELLWVQQVYGKADPKNPDESEKTELVKDFLIERQMARVKTSAFQIYDEFGIGATRDWIRNTTAHPSLQKAAHELIRARTMGFLKVNDRWHALKQAGQEPAFRNGHCPLCNDRTKHGHEVMHLLTSCDDMRIERARKNHLEKSIDILRLQLQDFDFISSTNPLDRSALTGKSYSIEVAVAVYLLGGMIECNVTHFTMGFGHLPDFCQGLARHGWTYTAKFLSEVLPIYHKALFPNGGGNPYGTPVDIGILGATPSPGKDSEDNYESTPSPQNRNANLGRKHRPVLVETPEGTPPYPWEVLGVARQVHVPSWQDCRWDLL